MEESSELKKLQKTIRYDGCVKTARDYMNAGNLDVALSAAQEARQYLSPGDNAEELDSIIRVIDETRERTEKDKQEKARREDQERTRAAEAARLKAQREREEEQQRQREEVQRQKDQRKRTGSLCSTIGAAILVVIGIWFIISMGGFDGRDFGPWFEPKIPVLVAAFCITGMIVGVGTGLEEGGMGGAVITAGLGIAFIIVMAIAYSIQTGRIIDGVLIMPIIMVGLWIPALIVALISGAAAKAGRS